MGGGGGSDVTVRFAAVGGTMFRKEVGSGGGSDVTVEVRFVLKVYVISKLISRYEVRYTKRTSSSGMNRQCLQSCRLFGEDEDGLLVAFIVCSGHKIYVLR